jgi:hypothetical protein
MSETIQQKLGTPQVARRCGVSKRTVDRWLEDESLGFPQPMDILGRRYLDLHELEQFERQRIGRKYDQERKERIKQMTEAEPKQKKRRDKGKAR